MKTAALVEREARSPVLQRRCACGGTTVAGGECAACKAKRLAGNGGVPALDAAPPIVHDVLRSTGSALEPAVRSTMEARFGHDFSRVRVHTDSEAAASARAVRARAYTVGRDVVFDRSAYEPRSRVGHFLLAHELAHVVQQDRLSSAGTGAIPVAERHGAAEAEAQTAARSAVGLGRAGPIARSAVGLQAADADGSPAPGPTPRPATPPAREVIAIRLGHREERGFGRFDVLLYRSCEMRVQLRMNFTFKGPWPRAVDKLDWQGRFITSVETAWSRRHRLRAVGPCGTGCATVTPFVSLYAPHSSPHVNVEVTYSTSRITSKAGSGVAHLDSLDLTPVIKEAGVEPMVPGVHEFGHLVGRRDLYRADRTCAPGYPLAGIMCFGNTVTPADYTPFANALSAMTGCTYTA